MNFFVRESRLEDAPQIQELGQEFLLGNLSSKISNIEKRIQISQDSFNKKLPKEARIFLFVLEDRKQKKLLGSSQILASFNKKNHPYFMMVKEEGETYLKLEKDLKGKNQLGGLVLHSAYRGTKDKLGLLLAASRLLYIRPNLEEFSETLEVNLTAPFSQQGRYNAFWQEVGRKYIDKDLKDILEMYGRQKETFFENFPKEFRIPLKSLSQKAQESLTMVHPETQAAYQALLKLGFYPVGKHHFIDGALYLEAQTREIPFISQSCSARLKLQSSSQKARYLVAQQTSKGFKSCFAEGSLKEGVFSLEQAIPFLEDNQEVWVYKKSIS
ncbi:MAG: arginine N-succinyltransferase [Bdellovibrionales bacterium]